MSYVNPSPDTIRIAEVIRGSETKNFKIRNATFPFVLEGYTLFSFHFFFRYFKEFFITVEEERGVK